MKRKNRVDILQQMALHEAPVFDRPVERGGVAPAHLNLIPDNVLPFPRKETDQPPHFRIDFDTGIISRDGKDLPRLRSLFYLSLLQRFSHFDNPPSLEELINLAHSQGLAYDSYSISVHLANFKTRLGGNNKLVSKEKREAGTFFVFHGVIEIVSESPQSSTSQTAPEEDLELFPGIPASLSTARQSAAEPYLAKKKVTAEDVMRSILDRGPITVIDLASELHPGVKPEIAARKTVTTLIRLNSAIRQEGLTIPARGITLLGIMNPSEKQTAIQAFEEKKKNKSDMLDAPDTVIKETSPEIIVDLTKHEVCINGQIIKFNGEQNWEVFLLFLNNPGKFLANTDVFKQVVAGAKRQSEGSGISSIIASIDIRSTNTNEPSLFIRTFNKTALAAVVSFLLPGQQFSKEQDGKNDEDNPIWQSDHILPKKIRRQKDFGLSDNPRLVSAPIPDAPGLHETRFFKDKKQTPPIRLTANELDTLKEILGSRNPHTVFSLEKALRLNCYTVFDERGGLEKVLMSLDRKIKAWGIALEIEEDALEKARDIIKITAYTPEHKLLLEPVDAVLYDDTAQQALGPRERKRQPSHGKFKI